MNQQATPTLAAAPEIDGYKKDARGNLVPVTLIKPVDLLRDEFVTTMIHRARSQQQILANFKQDVYAEIAALAELSAREYDIQLGGKKGNLTLRSFDGRYKIQYAINEHITFDERLQAAKSLIDRCIHRWSEGSSDEIKVLVDHAFQTDKEGNINTARVLSLRRLAITDSDWRTAMDAISDSIQVTGSKSYVRFYERIGDSDRYQAIALDIAAL